MLMGLPVTHEIRVVFSDLGEPPDPPCVIQLQLRDQLTDGTVTYNGSHEPRLLIRYRPTPLAFTAAAHATHMMERNRHTVSTGDLVDRRQHPDRPVHRYHRSLTNRRRLPRPDARACLMDLGWWGCGARF